MNHWQRAQSGQHTIVLGPRSALGPPPRPLRVVRVTCDGLVRAEGPLKRARSRIEQLLGEAQPLRDRALDAVGTALRRRLLGDGPEPAPETELLALGNRLCDTLDRGVVLVIEDVDRADPATLHSLRRLLTGGGLRLPVILQLERRPDGESMDLVAAITRVLGPEAVVELSVSEATPEKDRKADVELGTYDPAALDPTIRDVLRAAAIIGPRFEPQLVASLLGCSDDDVLLRLQRAFDNGVPITDRGDGCLALPEALVVNLRNELLPSLTTHWNRRLAELLACDHAIPEPHEPGTEPADAEPEPEPQSPDPSRPEDEKHEEPSPVVEATPTFADVFEPPSATSTSVPDSRAGEPAPSTREDERPPTATNAPPPEPWPAAHDEFPATATNRTARARRVSAPRPRDPLRAARHFAAADDIESAVAAYTAGAEQLLRANEPLQALAISEEGLSMLEETPETPAWRTAKAGLLLAAGRAQWLGVGVAPGLTLHDALATLERTQQHVDEHDIELRSATSQAIAGVCYDLGDVRSLERALQELSDAALALQAAGESVAAARLLNDQAAVYLRAGDPVRATHLLNRSRDVFSELRRDAPTDAVLLEEQAETDHLLARLPLHARLKPGRELDAYALALGHARAAQSAYRQLERPYRLGRVWETMGRLELLRDNAERAGQYLMQALELQRAIADVVGLARTASAIADLHSAGERSTEALAILGDSIKLNLGSGSPIGLAYNRRALERLTRATASTANERATAAELERLLARGEAVFGRTELPPEAD